MLSVIWHSFVICYSSWIFSKNLYIPGYLAKRRLMPQTKTPPLPGGLAQCQSAKWRHHNRKETSKTFSSFFSIFTTFSLRQGLSYIQTLSKTLTVSVADKCILDGWLSLQGVQLMVPLPLHWNLLHCRLQALSTVELPNILHPGPTWCTHPRVRILWHGVQSVDSLICELPLHLDHSPARISTTAAGPAFEEVGSCS